MPSKMPTEDRVKTVRLEVRVSKRLLDEVDNAATRCCLDRSEFVRMCLVLACGLYHPLSQMARVWGQFWSRRRRAA